jgi:hypothetical protein
MKFLNFRFFIGLQCAAYRSRPVVGGCIGIGRSRESWPILSPSWPVSVRSETDDAACLSHRAGSHR